MKKLYSFLVFILLISSNLYSQEPPTITIEEIQGTWRVKAEVSGHMAVGPPESYSPDWWQASAFDKSQTGLYDDSWIIDGQTLTHDTGEDGAIYGKKQELDAAFPNNNPYDVDNGDGEYTYYIQDDYSDIFEFSQMEDDYFTLGFSNNGNIGFYTSIGNTGGESQQFQILEVTETTMHVRNVGSEGLAWYGILTNEPIDSCNFSTVQSTDLSVTDSDTDGLEVFNLTLAISGTVDYEVTYYETQADAEFNTNQIVNPETFTNSGVGIQTIYARIVSLTEDCFTVLNFNIEVVTFDLSDFLV